MNLLADGGYLKFFREAAEKKGTAAAIILSELSCPLHRCLSETEVFARMYLVYKILNIASTYPHYSEYSRYGDINKTLSSKRLSVSHTKLRELVREVCDRKTHIEQKVHQVLNFITRMNDLRNYYVDFDTTWLDYVFTFEDYRQHLELPIEFDSIEDCLRSLPPNIFRQTIYLKRKREDGTWEDKNETVLNISQMNEKPKASYAEEFLGVKGKDGERKYWSVFGQYVLTPEVFEQLRQDINESTDLSKEVELTTALEKVRQREGMIGVQLQGHMFDMGNFNAYRNCVKDFTKK